MGGIKPASAAVFGLKPLETLAWAPVFHTTGWLLNDTAIFWEMFYLGCLKMCH
jgi:hypothetical protein